MAIKRFVRRFLNRAPVTGELASIRSELVKLNREVQWLKTTSAVALQEALLEKNPRYHDPRRLLRHGAQVCSQGGEDGIIREIFRRIQMTDRMFVEVGVGDGSENNTAFLLSQGWRGVWIDGSASFVRNLEKRPDLRGDCLRSLVSFVTRENVASLFQQLAVPAEFDLLSLDIDQNTFYVWEALAGLRPRVVVVEYNASLPADLDWKVNYDGDRVWDGSQNFGASLKAFELLGRRLGYSLVGCEFGGANAFFVRDDLVGDHFAAPFTAENHHEPPRYPLLHRCSHRAAILDRPRDA